jgi:very-short-patch-repair endonuclease
MNPDPRLASILQRTRANLLDLSLRNRLLNTPRTATRSKRLDIVDEKSNEVFRILVREQRAMTFLSGQGEESGPSKDAARPNVNAAQVEVAFPEDRALESETEGLLERHVDTRLQTKLTIEALQKRLLALHYDAQTIEEEQGVSILYLALGFLEWYEAPSFDQPRFAPLLLVPVDLERPKVTDRFRLRYNENEITTNLSLQAKLSSEFSLVLPEVPDAEELLPAQYYAAVADAVAGQRRWKVHADDMTLWFFSFAKYLMYRDLDPASWPDGRSLTGQPLIRGLLQEGFRGDPPICGDEEKIDTVIPLSEMTHVTDADSSQALVIEEVRRRRHLVVQGPPGTGKSQTITNIVATAVKAGQRVLFVAEKMAALEVVKGRLDRLGLGAVCLELHSHKANKRIVLEELGRTLDLGRPKVSGAEAIVDRLSDVCDRLNRHAEAMNAPILPAGSTPYQLLGEMAKVAADGLSAPGFSLPEPEAWSKAQVDDRTRRLRDFLRHAEDLGPPTDHAWRGVRRTSPLLPSDLADVMAKIEKILPSLDEADAMQRQLADRMAIKVPDAPSLQMIQTLHDLGEWVVAVPSGADRPALAGEVWNTRHADLKDLIERGISWDNGHKAIEALVAPSGWEVDPGPIRRTIAAHGRSWFRWFRSDYRNAVADLRGILVGPLPPSHAERLALLDKLSAARSHWEYFARSGDELGRTAFGSSWRSRSSDWELLNRLVKWDSIGRDRKWSRHRIVIAKITDPRAISELLRRLREAMTAIREQLAQIIKFLDLRHAEAFGHDDWAGTTIPSIRSRLQAWWSAPNELSRWIAYSVRFDELKADGLGELLNEIAVGRVAPGRAVALFRQAYCEALVRHVWKSRPELTRFDGRSHESLVEEFRTLDRDRIALARREVAAAHFAGMPHESERGEMAIVRNEIGKKRRHMPIRKLLKEAGNAVQAIKPVFMMSPISIAQYLSPGSLEFDLMVMDEASQVSAEDALGAVARAKQLVVVGDSKQLPPSRFFSKAMEEETPAEDDESFVVGDIESVLGLCLARGLPQRMLRWHYRSRHHSLIAVSNREFYDQKLCVIPSPSTASAGHGLQFRFVADGVFDRGGTATNAVEARAVAEAILDHARNHPTRSLGVGTFSVAQRDAILDELEWRRKQSPATEPFFAASNAEPFFVKNLENIQGEERDAIFISIGYAKDASGYMAMAFGPLSAEGGERRLNVLISRAKELCVVFSSIRSEDIDLARAKTLGPRALKSFLRFAETGEMDTPAATGRDFDSDFERQVAAALRQHGHVVDCQVGTAGFIIDLAVVDPDRPGRYLLGIECDGATYHSSRWARDRDRLREQVLCDRGWRIHRIWSTDWFHRRDEQLRKTLEAIDAAKRQTVVAEPVPATAAPTIDRDDAVPNTISGENGVEPYREADFEVPRTAPLVDVRVEKLAEFAKLVIEAEGPVHREEVAKRLSTLWGYQRLGSRIEDAVERAVDYLTRKGIALDAVGFLSLAGSTVRVRSRANTKSAGLRKPEYLPPAELAEAVRMAVSRNIGLTRDETVTAVARMLSFASTTTKLRDAILSAIDVLIFSRTLELRDDRLLLATVA